jgi:polar amino acid transport system substrate-binding protein
MRILIVIASLMYAAWLPRAFANEKLVISTQAIISAKICDTVVTEALKKVNIEVEAILLPSKRAFYMSNQGQTDGEMCRMKGFNDTYKNLIRIDPSIFPFDAHVFTIDKRPNIEVNGWDGLKKYAIGIQAGHYYAKNATQGFLSVTPTYNDLSLIRKLDAGIIDVAVMVRPDAIDAINQAGQNNLLQGGEIIMLEPAIASFPLHFYLHKKNAHLLPMVNKAIKDIVDSGRALAIYQQMLAELVIRKS